MIALSPIAERLTKAGCLRVLGVLEYAALDAPPTLLPAHFVTPVDDTAAPNRLSGIVDQRVSVQFQVVTVVEAKALRTARPSEDLIDEVARVRAALIGWQIPGMSMPTEYAGGRLLSAGGREAVWASRFRTAYHERTPLQ